MYNLTVDTAHTFFVGDGQWLVHNIGKCPFVYPNTTPDREFGEGFGTITSRNINSSKINGVEIDGRFYPEDIPLPSARRIPEPERRPSGRNSGHSPAYPSIEEAWRAARITADSHNRRSVEFIQVADGKWRSVDGRYQIRATQGSEIGPHVQDPHIHLEILDTTTGQVRSNVHFYFDKGN